MKRILLVMLVGIILPYTTSAVNGFEITNYQESYFQQGDLDLYIDGDLYDDGDLVEVRLESLDNSQEEVIYEKLGTSSVGTGIGLILDLLPGDYRYALYINEKPTAYSREFEVKLNNIRDIKIENLSVELDLLPYNQRTAEKDYVLSVKTYPADHLRDLNSKTYIRCQSEISLSTKLGSLLCSRDYGVVENNWSGNSTSQRYYIDDKDLVLNNKLVVKHELYNKNNVLLDSQTQEINLVANKVSGNKLVDDSDRLFELLLKVEAAFGKESSIYQKLSRLIIKDQPTSVAEFSKGKNDIGQGLIIDSAGIEKFRFVYGPDSSNVVKQNIYLQNSVTGDIFMFIKCDTVLPNQNNMTLGAENLVARIGGCYQINSYTNKSLLTTGNFNSQTYNLGDRQHGAFDNDKDYGLLRLLVKNEDNNPTLWLLDESGDLVFFYRKL